jgi:hypothetical protein
VLNQSEHAVFRAFLVSLAISKNLEKRVEAHEMIYQLVRSFLNFENITQITLVINSWNI